MARSDLEAFLKERISIFDETIDTTPGSPFDTEVIQPTLNRLGADPFSMDMPTFIETRLLQEFPDLANKNGDAVTDLLEKPATVLWDPIVREIQRVKASLSFKDPTVLTTDEAEALGANLFAQRETGKRSVGVVRIYFAAPQNISCTPANFLTTQTGLHFFPTSIQSIQTTEMLLNQEGSLFYFDVNVIAETEGDQYNIDIDSVVTIANIASAVRVTNKRRFRDGLPAETAEQFIDRAQQELTERSLVTSRGINAVIPAIFSEVTRLAVVGFNDPEMQRDVLKGGGLGPILAFGVHGNTISDGENQQVTRRVSLSEVLSLNSGGFPAIIGPLGPVQSLWTLTVVDAFNGLGLKVRDLTVRAVVDDTTLDVNEQVMNPQFGMVFAWTLRKSGLTLSDIPGGILFPDSPNGTVTIPDGEVHIGGVTDFLTRGIDLDTGTALLTSIVDDDPIVSGVDLSVHDAGGTVVLGDYVLNTNYSTNDPAYTAIAAAAVKGWSLEILEGPAAGTYRVLSATQPSNASPVLVLFPAPLYANSPSFQNLRWKLVDVIDINLVEPKETRVSGADMFSIQNIDQLETTSGTDFDSFGVAPGDIVRLLDGPDAGDFTVLQILSPFFVRVQVDRPLKFSTSGLSYQIFRKNTAAGITRPIIRVTSIDLLDTSGQPIGSTVPYSRVVDARSSAFANFGIGVRAEGRDGALGVVGQVLSGSPPSANVQGLDLKMRFNNGNTILNVVFAGANPILLTDIVEQINTAAGVIFAVVIDGNRLGLIPIGDPTAAIAMTEVVGGAASTLLFNPVGGNKYHSSREVNSATVQRDFLGWSGGLLKPEVDQNIDVIQITSGSQVGFYDDPVSPLPVLPPGVDPAIQLPSGLIVAHDFAPEVNAVFQFGSRSVGTARLYFLEPTSAQFSTTSRFQAMTALGQTVNFKPDPTLNAQVIPALPSGTKPDDGQPSDPVLHSDSVDFIQKGIQPGDILTLDFIPITGTVNLSDPIPNLQFLTLVISVGGGPDKVITFLQDSLSIPANAVTRSGMVSQINQSVGQSICDIVTIAGANFLEFYPSVSVDIRATGTANTALLGSAGSFTNISEDFGTYTIIDVAQHDLTIDNSIPPFGFQTIYTRHQFSIAKGKTQRIGSTQMATQTSDAGLYYMDVQLVSEGTGDLWNIAADLQMIVTGYDADGYYLTTTNPNLTFSPAEDVTLHISPTIRTVGVSDDPDNATQLSGQNIQVNYEFSSLTTAINNFITAESERVVNESPLARHLVPHYVRFEVDYIGGSKENIVQPLIEEFIRNVLPDDTLDASDIEQIILSKGATTVTNPLDLVAVVYSFDRSILLQRSSDQLSTTRLSAFIPDQITLTRKFS